MRTHLGWLTALAVFVLDRLSKWWIVEVYDLPERGSVAVLPFFSLTMVWNQGISLGLFQADSDLGRWLLIGVTGAISLALAVWLARVETRLLAVAIGLVLGGAVGNIIDRLIYPGVADFFHFHAFGASFYVFNVADSAISIGVVLLLWDSLRSSPKQPT